MVLAFGLLLWADMLVPVAMPELGLVLLGVLVPARGFFGEEREKAKIKGIMQAYLSDKVMQKILAHPDNLKLGGVKLEITIMFCDIRGFTAYCDERDPQETMDVLNEYMETMTQVVFDHDGTIDKYIGDCIMAFWNAPEPQPDHAQKAVVLRDGDAQCVGTVQGAAASRGAAGFRMRHRYSHRRGTGGQHGIEPEAQLYGDGVDGEFGLPAGIADEEGGGAYSGFRKILFANCPKTFL